MPELSNPKWERFCHEYIQCWNKKDAVLRAGYQMKENSAYVQGCELYKRPVIKARIKELMAEMQRSKEVSVGRVILELSRIAFADVTQIVESWAGNRVNFKSLDQVPKNLRCAIKSVSTTQAGIQVEFHDKLKALQMLAQYLGMYDPNNKEIPAEGPQIYLPANNRDPLPLPAPQTLDEE